jgi:Zn-dependent protease
MLPTRQGSLRLFRFAGIDVNLHWSWFIVAVFGINMRGREYTSVAWNALEYIALFGIVLLHEMGHALACRQVGGKADTIVLWPLGGVAYVSPPPRPAPILWSIAAGPLVNLILAPVLTVLLVSFARGSPFGAGNSNVASFIQALWFINLAILFFNLLPIYPLDGGQIVRALLWFVVGRARSLMVTALVGFIGVAALLGLALLLQSVWIGILAVFILFNCWQGLTQARLLSKAEQIPRHSAFRCPECGESPFRAPLWKCSQCGVPFDTFEHCAACPACGARFEVTACPQCGRGNPLSKWIPSTAA